MNRPVWVDYGILGGVYLCVEDAEQIGVQLTLHQATDLAADLTAIIADIEANA